MRVCASILRLCDGHTRLYRESPPRYLNQLHISVHFWDVSNAALFLDPRFKSLAHFSRAMMDGVIKHVENEICELMKINVTVTIDQLLLDGREG